MTRTKVRDILVDIVARGDADIALFAARSDGPSVYARPGYSSTATGEYHLAKRLLAILDAQPAPRDHEAVLREIVQRHVPNAVGCVVGVAEWDNGYWYDHYGIGAILPTGTPVLIDLDGHDADQDAAHEACTELTEQRGPLGRHDSLTLTFVPKES